MPHFCHGTASASLSRHAANSWLSEASSNVAELSCRVPFLEMTTRNRAIQCQTRFTRASRFPQRAKPTPRDTSPMPACVTSSTFLLKRCLQAIRQRAETLCRLAQDVVIFEEVPRLGHELAARQTPGLVMTRPGRGGGLMQTDAVVGVEPHVKAHRGGRLARRPFRDACREPERFDAGDGVTTHATSHGVCELRSLRTPSAREQDYQSRRLVAKHGCVRRHVADR